MKLNKVIVLVVIGATSAAAFVSPLPKYRQTTVVKGYLDDLSDELYQEIDQPDVKKDSREANNLDKKDVDRYGPGNLDSFVDFEEFDGGDGQMGVAGDGASGLDKSDFATGSLNTNVAKVSTIDKSKARSAKNAWGTSTGYADKLIEEKGMDTARAQQLENWAQQQEIRKKNQEQKYLSDEFDKVTSSGEEDWRSLASFGVERNEEFDLNEAFGAVTPGDEIEEIIELKARTGGGVAYHVISVKNPFMGFADFRAAFTPSTSKAFSLTPKEGALQSSTATEFNIGFRPEVSGICEAYLVLQTEDLKKTWKIIGSTG